MVHGWMLVWGLAKRDVRMSRIFLLLFRGMFIFTFSRTKYTTHLADGVFVQYSDLLRGAGVAHALAGWVELCCCFVGLGWWISVIALTDCDLVRCACVCVDYGIGAGLHAHCCYGGTMSWRSEGGDVRGIMYWVWLLYLAKRCCWVRYLLKLLLLIIVNAFSPKESPCKSPSLVMTHHGFISFWFVMDMINILQWLVIWESGGSTEEEDGRRRCSCSLPIRVVGRLDRYRFAIIFGSL